MAGNSISMWEMVTLEDVKVLRKVAKLTVLFDASHASSSKNLHFELDLEISQAEVTTLCKRETAATFYKFGFAQSHMQARLRPERVRFKYECPNFHPDLIRRASHSKRVEIEKNIATVLAGGVGGMVKDITY